MTNPTPNENSKEPVLIANSLTGLALGILAVAGYSVSEDNAALIGQVIAFVVPIVINLVAGYVARGRVTPVR